MVMMVETRQNIGEEVGERVGVFLLEGAKRTLSTTLHLSIVTSRHSRKPTHATIRRAKEGTTKMHSPIMPSQPPPAGGNLNVTVGRLRE
jgi:hypothetical protein